MMTAWKVLNDVTSGLDNKQDCVAIFIDLSLFDTVDHHVFGLQMISVVEHKLLWLMAISPAL